MKYMIMLCLFICCSSSTWCQAQDKTEYDFKPDVSEENRQLFVERAEKGKILYKIHCTDCHGIFAKAKDSIPDFTKQQIDNYHARSILAFKIHSTVRGLSADQLDYILTFLRLRKVEK